MEIGDLSKKGIYTITNKLDNKIYVGSTTFKFTSRKYSHFSKLIANKHQNSHLQKAVNKYGINNFEFDILEECEPELCLSLEYYWINMLNTLNNNYGYNAQRPTKINTGVFSTRKGIPKSEKHKEKISKALKENCFWKGKKQSPEIIANRVRKNIKLYNRIDIDGNILTMTFCDFELLGFSKRSISKHIKYKTKHYKNFKWEIHGKQWEG